MFQVGETLDFSTLEGALHALDVTVKMQADNFELNAITVIDALISVGEHVASQIAPCDDTRRQELATILSLSCRSVADLQQARLLLSRARKLMEIATEPGA